MKASALWRHQSHEGISLRAPCEVFRHFLFSDKYYENWQIQKMPPTHVVVVNPCRRCKLSACSWPQHLLFFFHINIHCAAFFFMLIYFLQRTPGSWLFSFSLFNRQGARIPSDQFDKSCRTQLPIEIPNFCERWRTTSSCPPNLGLRTPFEIFSRRR